MPPPTPPPIAAALTLLVDAVTTAAKDAIEGEGEGVGDETTAVKPVVGKIVVERPRAVACWAALLVTAVAKVGAARDDEMVAAFTVRDVTVNETRTLLLL